MSTAITNFICPECGKQSPINGYVYEFFDSNMFTGMMLICNNCHSEIVISLEVVKSGVNNE